MKTTRTYYDGCRYCGATGKVPFYGNPNITGDVTNICPVCNGSKVILITETMDTIEGQHENPYDLNKFGGLIK